MTDRFTNLEELHEGKLEENKNKKHKYTLVEDIEEIKSKTDNTIRLIEKHNPNKENLETVLLSTNVRGNNFVGNKEININNIVGTSRVDLKHLSWHDALIFLQRFSSVLPLEELDVPHFLDKMKTNNFAETLKLIEYPKNSKKYYILDGTSRIILARNLGLETIAAEIYSE